VIGSALTLVLFDLAVVVDGDVSCPEPASVARELGGLMPADGRVREPDIADLSREGPDLHLELRRGDGSWVAVRNIPATQSCDDLAVSVAVVIAAWEADLASGTMETVKLSGQPRARRRYSAGAGRRLLAMAPTDRVGAPLPALLSSPSASPPAGPQVEYILGLGASVAGGSLASAVLVDVSARPADGPLGFGMAFDFTSTHRTDFSSSPGALQWSRAALGMGARYRATGEDMFLDVQTSLKGALLRAEAIDEVGGDVSTTVGDFGLGTGARVGFGAPRRKRVQPWIGLDFAIWSRSVTVATSSFTVSAPTVDISLYVGLLLGGS
jgi:hypothetical protein